ncbi:MAG: hypothetical protein U5L05_17555 [Rubrivivax sp.]|nr:hypothetical protein [Rubrivivax sp.]
MNPVTVSGGHTRTDPVVAGLGVDEVVAAPQACTVLFPSPLSKV